MHEHEIPSIQLIAQISFEKFKELPKTGKPATTNKEWTVLSTIIQHDTTSNISKVIALGTGTKCIGYNQLCPQGFILNDSHAEVIARRTFLRYIYNNLLQTNENDSIFIYNDRNCCFDIKNKYNFHFFSTHPPCGDATILPSTTNSLVSLDENDGPSPSKIYKINDDSVIFTGAKLLNSNITDPMDQQEGEIRTKPGRGVRTLSMSCSDKLSKWNLMGIQGALLDSILSQPIYMTSYNFCGGNVNLIAIKRTLYDRWQNKKFQDSRFQAAIAVPAQIRIANDLHFDFEYQQSKEPSPASISWCDITSTIQKRPFEVAIAGKKQGATKKNSKIITGSLEISKIKLFQNYKDILIKYPKIWNKLFLNQDHNNKLIYSQCKMKSLNYQRAWNLAKTDHYFGNWTQKSPDLLNFFIELK